MSVRLSLPPHMIFHHDLRLMVVRPRGVLTKKRIQRDIAVVTDAENRNEVPFNRFVDLSEVTQIRMDLAQASRIAINRSADYQHRAPVKSAYYVTTQKAAQIANMCATLAETSPLEIRVFEDISAAAEWLGVSDKDLELSS
jgi:hypothetical protein